MATLNDPSDTRGRLIAASQVNGTNVYNRSGEKLGSIYDVVLEKSSGQAEYAIMSFGGFLGIGDVIRGEIQQLLVDRLHQLDHGSPQLGFEDLLAGLEPFAAIVSLQTAQKRQSFGRESGKHITLGERWMTRCWHA